jgi:hypothetical protein
MQFNFDRLRQQPSLFEGNILLIELVFDCDGWFLFFTYSRLQGFKMIVKAALNTRSSVFLRNSISILYNWCKLYFSFFVQI